VDVGIGAQRLDGVIGSALILALERVESVAALVGSSHDLCMRGLLDPRQEQRARDAETGDAELQPLRGLHIRPFAARGHSVVLRSSAYPGKVGTDFPNRIFATQEVWSMSRVQRNGPCSNTVRLILPRDVGN